MCKHDNILLFETWTNKNSDNNINGYKYFYRKFQNRRAKRNSGGVAIYLKYSIAKGITVVKNRFDTIIWLKLHKSYFKLDYDIYIAGVYMWVENSPAYNVINEDLFDIIQCDVSYYQMLGQVLLTCDWNARVGNGDRRDYIECDRTVHGIDDYGG